MIKRAQVTVGLRATTQKYKEGLVDLNFVSEFCPAHGSSQINQSVQTLVPTWVVVSIQSPKRTLH